MRTFWQKHGWSILGLTILVGYIFGPIWRGQTFIFGDNFSLMVPGKLWAAENLRHGVIPFWNPFSLAGQPFMADINQSVWYPSTWLFMMLNPAMALNVTILFHVLFAAVGMYWWLYEVKRDVGIAMLGSSLWLFSGPMMWSLNNISVLQSVSWLPWTLLAVLYWQTHRNKLFSLAYVGLLLLSLFGGHPQVFLYVWGVSVIYGWWIARRNKLPMMKFLSLSTVLVLFISAFQLIPTLLMARSSTRMQITSEEILSQSMPPLNLLTLWFPHLFANPAIGMAWGIAWNRQPLSPLFIPWIIFGALELIVYKRKVKAWLWPLLVLLGLGLALGSYIPGAKWLYINGSPLKMWRNLPLHLLVAAFGLSVMGALAFAEVRKQRWRWLMKFLLIIGGVSFCLLVSNQEWFAPMWRVVDTLTKGRLGMSSFHTLARDKIIVDNLLWVMGVNGVLSGLSWYLVSIKKRWLAGCFLLSLNMALMAKPLVLTGSSQVYTTQDTALTDWLREHTKKGERVLTLNEYEPWTGFTSYNEGMLLTPPFQASKWPSEQNNQNDYLTRLRQSMVVNWNNVNGLVSVDGYSALVPSEYAQYWQNDNTLQNNLNFPDRVDLDDSRLDMTGVKYLVLARGTYTQLPERIRQFPMVYQDERVEVLERLTAKAVVIGQDAPIEIDSYHTTTNAVDMRVINPKAQVVTVTIPYQASFVCSLGTNNCDVRKSQEGWTQIPIPAGRLEIRLSYAQPYKYPSLIFTGIGGLWLVTLLRGDLHSFQRTLLGGS